MAIETEGNVMTKARCSFEGDGKVYKPRNARIIALRAGKDKEMNSPLEPL